MRQPTVQVRLGVVTVTTSGTTRRPAIFRTVSKTPGPQAAQRIGRSCVQLEIWRISPHTWSHVLSWCTNRDGLGNSVTRVVGPRRADRSATHEVYE
jgi:hypothetical protein